MEKPRIDKAMAVINYAISKSISINKACVECGYARSYVKNVKHELLQEKSNPYNKEILKSLLEAFTKYQNNIKSESIKGFSDFETIHKKLVDKSYVEKNKEKVNITQNGNEMTYEWVGGDNYGSDHIRTLDQLLKAAEVDMEVWKVKNHIVNKWDVTAIIDKQPKTIQNFQVKATLERVEDRFKFKTAADIFVDMTKNYEPPVFNVSIKKINSNQENNLLEVSIFDLHIGKLCWAGETGENYDVKIASKRFIKAIETLLEHASGFNYNRILFPVGNDFFNSDNLNNTTTKGTPQEEDLRWQKTFSVGVRLLVDGINLLKQKGVPVDVMVIPGNHDFERSYYMGSFLEAWFNNDNQVNVNNGASPRKYCIFGQVLLGFTHGSEEKENTLPLLMASDIESKPYWSTTKYHEYHVGHQHRKKFTKYTVLDKSKMVSEDLGVTVRCLSSLTSTENWHHGRGYIGQIKAADAFIWNDEEGLIAHLNSNLMIE